MAEKRDYYEVLGISKTATDSEIKKAYREMAKKYHPDANPDDKNAEKLFKEAGEAYDVLSDQSKRQQYDQFGHRAFDMGGGGFQGGFSQEFDMGDIFGSVFGDIFGGGMGAARRTGPLRGADVSAGVTIKFEEAVFGVKKDIPVSTVENCDSCKGTGAKAGTFAETCKKCGGTGQERVTKQTLFGTMATVRTCSACDGSGKFIKEKCGTCGGRGKVRKNKKYEVNIPAGIDSGQSIRLSGKGEVGDRGGEPGDLYVTVNVLPHKVFKRKGIDLQSEVTCSFSQAALGDEITVSTIDGEEKVVIKPGTQPGSVFTLSGKGVPNLRNPKIRGNQFTTVNIAVPTNLSEKQSALLRQFAEACGEKLAEKPTGFFDKVKNTFR